MHKLHPFLRWIVELLELIRNLSVFRVHRILQIGATKIYEGVTLKNFNLSHAEPFLGELQKYKFAKDYPKSDYRVTHVKLRYVSLIFFQQLLKKIKLPNLPPLTLTLPKQPKHRLI